MTKIGTRRYAIGSADLTATIEIEAKNLSAFVGVVAPLLVDLPGDVNDHERPLVLLPVAGKPLARKVELPGPYPSGSRLYVTFSLSYAAASGADPHYGVAVTSAIGDQDESATRATFPGFRFDYQ